MKLKTENLRLRATKTVPVFEDGEWETSTHACHGIEIKGKGNGKRAAAVRGCCGRAVSAEGALCLALQHYP